MSDTTRNHTVIDEHPDLVELRARYDRASETPQARALEGLTFLAGLYTAISPWVIGFNHLSDVAVSNLIVGAALVVLALGLPQRMAVRTIWRG
jgi:SPW repeat